MKEKIAVFGCSWSHGCHTMDNHRNWPYYFAKNNPHYEVINYSICASSLTFQIYLYEYVKKNNPADKYIFQITRPERITYWNPETKFEELLVCRNDNYHSYGDGLENYKWFNNGAINKHVQPLTIGNVGPDIFDSEFSRARNIGYTDDSVKFATLYYKLMNDEYMELEWKMGIDYIKDKVDFCYLQTEGEDRKIKNIPCLEDILTLEYCKEHFWEPELGGTHFNKAGLQWTADWVQKNANL